MPTLKDVKARIATVLGGVAGIGAVFARMRPVNTEAVEQSQFVVDGVLNCCFIQRASAELETKGDTPPLGAQWDTIAVHAFYAVQDASSSEDNFDALVNAMLWAIFRDSAFPNYFAQTVKRSRAPKIKTVDFRHFGVRSALCHHAEITIQVMTQTT
jgi:hypothetical protein